MATGRGLGNDPLAPRGRRLPSVIPTTDTTEAPAAAIPAPTPSGGKVVAKDKTQVTAYLRTTVVEDARNAVVATMSNPEAHRNLSQLIEAAVTAEIERLRTQFNNGQPFPTRRVELQPGRPGGN